MPLYCPPDRGNNAAELTLIPGGAVFGEQVDKTRAIFDRYNIVSEADLREAAERRAQFGHNQVTKVVPLAR